jgi:hypothetical protein
MNYIFDHSLQRARAKSPEPIDGADEPLRGSHADYLPRVRTGAERESIGLYGQPRTTSTTSSSTLDLDEAYDTLQSGNPLQQLKTLRGLQQHGLLSDIVVAEKQKELLERALIGGGDEATRHSLQPRTQERSLQHAVEEGEPPSFSNTGVSDRTFESYSSGAATDSRVESADDTLPPWLAPAPMPDFSRRATIEHEVYDRNHDGGALWAVTGATTGGPPPRTAGAATATEHGARLLELEPDKHTDQRLGDSSESQVRRTSDSLQLSPEGRRGQQSFNSALSPAKRGLGERSDTWDDDGTTDSIRRIGSAENSPTDEMRNIATASATTGSGAAGIGAAHGTGSVRSEPYHRRDDGFAVRRRRADNDDDISPKPGEIPAEVIVCHLDCATDDARVVAQLLDARQAAQGPPLGFLS